MGWSCTAIAMETYRKLFDEMYRRTGNSNTWKHKGTKYFMEGSRVEHYDGSITGSIYKFIDETHIVKVGSFRIEGRNGELVRGGFGLKELLK